MQQYKSVLLPQEGCVIAKWNEQDLIQRGVTPISAKRLITYRDKAAARAMRGLLAQDLQPVPPDNCVQEKSLTEWLAKGVKFARTAVLKLGPTLPFPGAEAAALLVVLLDLVDTAMANAANLAKLCARAVALLDVLDAYHEELEAVRQYKGVVDEYVQLLECINAYARAYSERNCVVRMLTVGSDADYYTELVGQMGALHDRVTLLLAADSNARLQKLQDAVEEARQQLRAAEYKDPAAGALELLSELGGMKAVLADGEKLERVMQQLDVSARVTIKVVTSLLESHLDNGLQRFILQPDLRLFWHRQFKGAYGVPWRMFWEHFPERLKDNPADPDMVAELNRRLADEAAQAAFEWAVDRERSGFVKVSDLVKIFTETGLLEQIDSLMAPVSQGDTAEQQAERALQRPQHGLARAASDRQREMIVNGMTSAPPECVHASAAGPRCQLPPPVSNYTGRGEEAAAVADHLLTRGSLALLAPGGMGKSCLAADVGWRLLRVGWLRRGALWVDLREAGSAREVEARFCAALGLQVETSASTASIVAAFKLLGGEEAGHNAEEQASLDGAALHAQIPAAAALVVVDNAEDALLQANAATALQGLLGKVLHQAPAVRLLVTSRTSLRGHDPAPADDVAPASSTVTTQSQVLMPERCVGGISAAAAVQLVRAVAEDLSEQEAAEVARVCRCVPLVLCLVAEALVAGRLALEDLAKPAADDQPQPSTDADATASNVRLVLATLKRQHQLAAARLAVFPASFEVEGAAAILGLPEPQVQGLLAMLRKYSVVQRAGGGAQQFVMHSVVRWEAMHLGGRDTQSVAEGRFVSWVLGLLNMWAGMYRTAKEWKTALVMAREHQANIGKLMELLGAAGPSVPVNAPAVAMQANAPAQDGVGAPVEAGRCGWDPAAAATALSKEVAGLAADLHILRWLERPCRALLSLLGSEGAHGEAPDGAARPRSGLSEAHIRAESNVMLVLACVLKMDGRYTAAEAEARRCLELRQRVLRRDDPETLSALAVLAACVLDNGRYLEAEDTYKEVLEARRRELGEAHIDTIAALSGLARSIRSHGRHEEAEQLQRQALELWRQVFGDEHPDTVASLNGLASCLQLQGKYEEAETMYQQALELRSKVLGEEHPSTITSLSTLASCIGNHGRHLQAEGLQRQALALRRRVLGEEHPDTITSMSKLANSCSGQGKHGEAEALRRQVLEMRMRLLGEEHPDTTTALSNLACSLSVLRQHAESKDLRKRVLEIQRRVLHELHPDTINSINNLACSMSDQGRYADAEALHREALQLRTRVLKAEHPNTLLSLSNLATSIARQGRHSEAEALHREALEVRTRVLPEGHPAIATSLSSLASSVRAQGRHAEAEDLYRRLLDLRLRLQGPEHRDTVRCRAELAACLKAQGRLEEARGLCGAPASKPAAA